MKCLNPFVKAGEVYPCGKCLPCRFRSRRIWFHRVLLEASQHDQSSVVTLTYDDAALPEDLSLKPAHLRDWLKRFRKRRSERYDWSRLRYVACGEYGSRGGRPHYHAIMFGLPGCQFGRSGRLWCSDCGCDTCQDIAATWTVGVTSVDSLSRQSAAYVAGYVTRKVLDSYVGERLAPFMRMSNRPGIGAGAMWDVGSTLLKYNLPIPTMLAHGSRPMLLGRYLRRKLSEVVMEEIGSWPVSEAMQAVRHTAWAHGISQSEIYRQLNEGYASQLAQREALKENVL